MLLFFSRLLFFVSITISLSGAIAAGPIEIHSSKYPQLTQEVWDELAFRLLQDSRKISATRVISFLEGLETRLAVNSFERTDKINVVRAGVLGEMSNLSWSGSERLELIGLATELSLKMIGGEPHRITQLLMAPAAEGIPDFKLHATAFLAAAAGAGDGNSYLSTCVGEGGIVLGYGITFGNAPNIKGSFYSRNVARAPGFGGPIAFTADSDGIASDPNPAQIGDLGVFDAHFPVPDGRGWVHSFLPELMEDLSRNTSDEKLGTADEAELAKIILRLSDRRYPQSAKTLEFVQDFRRTLGDLTVEISDLSQLLAFLNKPIVQKPIVDTVFKQVSQYRKKRKEPLLASLSNYLGDSLDNYCGGLIAEKAPEQRTDIEPGSDD